MDISEGRVGYLGGVHAAPFPLPQRCLPVLGQAPYRDFLSHCNALGPNQLLSVPDSNVFMKGITNFFGQVTPLVTPLALPESPKQVTVTKSAVHTCFSNGSFRYFLSEKPVENGRQSEMAVKGRKVAVALILCQALNV